MDDFTQEVRLTVAQARVLLDALNGFEALAAGLVDGVRRCPWDKWEMDQEEGDDVPGALTHERGYLALIEATRKQLIEVTIP